MNVQKFLLPAAALALLVLAYRHYGGMGVAAAGGLLVMWLLMHFTRLMQILKRAAQRPIGYVDSAVMLNAKLKPGMTLMHVIAMTRSLGEQLSDKDAQPEVYRWKDNSESYVDATFLHGKLRGHEMVRPAPSQVTDGPAAAP
jgi:hypothetical protein